MTKSIYDQFDTATANLSAYAIFKGAESVGRVVFKRAKSGMRTTCFLQVWGAPMVKAFAPGCGYDKDSCSFEKAARLLKGDFPDNGAHVAALMAVKDEGERWSDQLRALGYTVQHVVD